MPKPDHSGAVTAELPVAWTAAFDRLPFDLVARAGTTCSEACVAWQQELMRFINGRLQSDAELWQKAVGCSNWADAAQLQQQWSATMLNDYMDEASRLGRIGSQMWMGLAAPPSPEPSAKSAGHGVAAAE